MESTVNLACSAERQPEGRKKFTGISPRCIKSGITQQEEEREEDINILGGEIDEHLYPKGPE